ncbi:MAG: AMP-binding protein [Planctomycetota bacterium]
MTDAPETPTYELGRTPAERELFWRLAPDALWIDGAPCAFARPEEGATRRFVLVGERRPASGEAASEGEGASPGAAPGRGTREAPMLALRRPPGWREGWGLRLLLVRPDGAVGTSLLLTLEDPVLRLEPLGEGWRLAVEPWVQSTWAAPAPPLPGSAAVPLGDPTWQRASRQSSVGAWSEDVPESRRGWGLPTRAEPAPFVELDLGQILYVDAVRVHWSDEVGPRGAVELNLYPRLGPGGAPWFADRAWHETVELRPGPWVEARPQALGRFLRVTLHPEGGPAPLALGGIEARACALTGATLLGSLERAFTLFGARPLFSCRERLPDGGLGPYRRWTPYRAVWEHARRLAAGLRERLQDAPRGPGARVFVGLCAPNQPEWACADLACLFDAFVVVPLPATDPAERLQVLIERAGVSAVFAGREQLPRLQEVQARVPTLETLIELPPLDRSDAPEPLPGALAYGALVEEGDALVEGFVPAARDPDDLHTVLFSSGSTGVPKGAMRSYAASNALLTAFGVSEPAVHLSFQPLSHFSERVYLPSLLVHGARIGFSSGGERLYEEFALLEPTAIGGPPRVFEVLFERYREDLARLQAEAPDADLEALEEQALAGLRGVFGGRLQSVSAGSAPPSRALMAFLGRLFDFCRVGEGYGSTECATITVDDQVHSGVDLRLVDVPELGYRTTDDPPRGEILVRTPHMVSGYLGDDAATAAGFDADGYFRTGDLGERQPDGRVRVIGRRTSVVKLAQGEFVSPERIEDALSASALVGELCVHADSLQASVVALAVPARGPLAQALGCAEVDVARLSDAQAAARVLADLRQVGRAAGLLPFELPAAVHLELEPLSVERGLRTSSNKLDRRAIAARYAEVFAALYAGARPSAGVLELVRAAAAEVLGDADPDADFAARLGVDSLSGVELVTAVSQRLGREVPLSAWHGASSLAELARRIQVQAGVGAAQDAEAGAAAEAQADLARPLQLEDGALAQAPPHPPLRVLLTGATGFLGAHLLEALLARGLEVRCLVRAQDDAAAAARPAAAAARWGWPATPGAPRPWPGTSRSRGWAGTPRAGRPRRRSSTRSCTPALRSTGSCSTGSSAG